MLKRFWRYVEKRKLFSGCVVFALILGSIYGWQKLKNSDVGASYVLASVENGTLIKSITGSGQINVENKIEINSKEIGEITFLQAQIGQEVKEGDLLAQVDIKDAIKAVRDAEISLQTAKLELENLLEPADSLSLLQVESLVASAKNNLDKLLSPPDEFALMQAENAVKTAQYNLEKAENDLNKLVIDNEQDLVSVYEDGYNESVKTFISLPNFIKDLKNVMGTESNSEENIGAYKLILGEESALVKKMINNFLEADNLFEKTSQFYQNIDRLSSQDDLYKLVSDTLDASRAISDSLISARNMFDAIININGGYKQYTIASKIDSLNQVIANDINSVNSIVFSLQKIKNNIDDINRDYPNNLKNVQLSVESAKQSLVEKEHSLSELKKGADQFEIDSAKRTLAEKELNLEKLKKGADSFDVRAKNIVIDQREYTLANAKQNLADYSVRAPFDGVIVAVNVKKGDTLSANATIATLITKQRIAEISLNEVDAAEVKIGQKVTLTFDAISDLSLSGVVAEVDTLGTVSQGVVTYNVKIIFDTQDDHVKPGMSVSASIITDVKQDILMIPNSAVKSLADAYYVEILENIGEIQLTANSVNIASNTAPIQKTIFVGISNDSMTEIKSGLKEGDKIIVRTNSSSTTTTKNQQSQGQSIFQMGGAGKIR